MHVRHALFLATSIVCGACLSWGPMPFATTAPLDGTSLTIERRGPNFDVILVAPGAAAGTSAEVIVIFPAGAITPATPMTEGVGLQPGTRRWLVGIQSREPGTYTFRVSFAGQRLERTASIP